MLAADSPLLHTWTIPARTGVAKIRLRNGSAGYVLAHFLLWLAETIEPLAGKVLDDWGYAYRPIRGQSSGYSNHASGTAADANATRHVLGRTGTFAYKVKIKGKSLTAAARIRSRLVFYGGVIRWGGDYHGRKDEMHFEIVKPLAVTEKLARRLMKTPRGKRLLAANPGQKAVILS